MTRKYARSKKKADTAPEEIGAIKKSWKNRIRVLLVYPNTYSVGMSNLGFQAVYTLLNQYEEVVCERFFLPDTKTYAANQFLSLESGKRFTNFHIIAFSLSFEQDYLNLLYILSKTGIPLYSKDRDTRFPLIIAGGVACMLNPEPVSAFIDCFLIGEAEAVLPDFMTHFDPAMKKKSCLMHLSTHISGLYAPVFYEATYNKDNTLRAFGPVADLPSKIRRRFTSDLSAVPTYSALLTPHTAFSRTFLIEIGRGCFHGCRFCAVGYVYRPPRFRPVSQLKSYVDLAIPLTNKIGLVSSAVSDLPGIIDLCNYAHENQLSLSFSSFRADSLTPEFADTLHRCNVKTATIAPEAGSERMRKVINKGITESDILQAVETLVISGIPNLKLYFMIGLPSETSDDIEAIVRLCRTIKRKFLETSRLKHKMGKISVSINPFIPKPFTPLQWAPMDHEHSLKIKIKQIKNGLRSIPNVNVQADKPRSAYIQTLLSRGDRRACRILSQTLKAHGNWTKVLKISSPDPDFFTYRQISTDELLPWDFIDHGIHKEFLCKEYQKATQVKK